MSTCENTIDLQDAYVAHTYGRFPLAIASGKGSEVFDEDGKRYIDLGTGIAVNTFGVADEAWQQAVIAQVSQVQHTSNLYYSRPCAEAARLLCKRTGMSKVFFGNSGAEANECAIKVMRKFAAETLGPDHNVVITLEQSFHGRTLATLAATGQDHFHQLFQPLPEGFVSVPANDLSALEQALANYPVAGMLIECIQGEGGIRVLDDDYVRGAAKLVQDAGAVFGVDEVQTGNGRTGNFFAYMHYGIQPDVVSTAKGLAGGLPIGACLMSERVAGALGAGDHGSTFGGNPVSCAAAVSVLSRIDDALLAEVREKGQLIRDTLEGCPGIEGISGRGLMVGITTTRPNKEVANACLKNGVLVLTAKDKVRLLPALNIPRELLVEALEVIKAACAE